MIGSMDEGCGKSLESNVATGQVLSFTLECLTRTLRIHYIHRYIYICDYIPGSEINDLLMILEL